MSKRQRTIVLLDAMPERLAARLMRLGSTRGSGRLEVTLDFPEVRVTGSSAALARIERSARRAVVSTDGRSVPEALLAELGRSGRRLAVAESCTGGLVGHIIASLPGASGVFSLGVVSYSNAAKVSVLGVSGRTLARHGAVSRQAAAEMLEGVLAAGDADAALSVTGIAGPTGGTARKPVGLVHMGAALGGRRRLARLVLPSLPRNAFRRLAAFLSMKMVLDLARGRSAG